MVEERRGGKPASLRTSAGGAVGGRLAADAHGEGGLLGRRAAAFVVQGRPRQSQQGASRREGAKWGGPEGNRKKAKRGGGRGREGGKEGRLLRAYGQEEREEGRRGEAVRKGEK